MCYHGFMRKIWKTFLHYLKKETVLCAALLLAAISAVFVTPDAQYADYIDIHTLLLLFCLMAVMAGAQRLGLFTLLSRRLLALVKTTRQMLLVLVFLPFFFSMLITNDVALITFVPFGITVIKHAKKERLLIPLVVLQTIAANLGSMLTPVGNPQNLYLYARAGLSLPAFTALMLPYTLAAALCLLVAVFLVTRSDSEGGLPLFSPDDTQSDFFAHPDASADISTDASVAAAVDTSADASTDVAADAAAASRFDTPRAALYGAAFALCLLTVAGILSPYLLTGIIFALIVILDRNVFRQVDYALLGTFVGFFIFVGNMGRLPAFRSFLSGILDGREQLVSILSSQIISNVPSALLLSGFTDNLKALIIGTNLGGLGTLIASMASLISYKQLARENPGCKARYLLWFTLANIVMLVILAGISLLV